MVQEDKDLLTAETINDFGEQWTNYRDNPGYYGSTELLADLFGPLLDLKSLQGQRVADIGSGTGRIVNMLLNAGAEHVVALEPSEAFGVLQDNTRERARQITYIKARGEALPPGLGLDLVTSLGVLHHIPDPAPVVKAMFDSLRPGGKALIWLYGREGNEAYLRFAEPIRAVTKRLPHSMLMGLCTVLNALLGLYILLCKHIPLPMHRYMRSVLARFSWPVRKITIYDQLNPAYAKYYNQGEAIELLAKGGFSDVAAWHRHGYSWTVVGTKPLA